MAASLAFVPAARAAATWTPRGFRPATCFHSRSPRINAWAIGTAYSGPNDTESSLVVHWDGQSWTRVAPPELPAVDQGITDVTSVRGTTELWAAGVTGNFPRQWTIQMLHHD